MAATLLVGPGAPACLAAKQSATELPQGDMTDSAEFVAREAAQATLLALASSLPTDELIEPNRVVVLPKKRVLTTDAAASLIASLKKPAECTATTKEGIMYVTCHPITHPDRMFLLEWQNRSIDEGDGPVGAVLRETTRDSASTPVLLLSRSGSLRVSLNGLNYWWRNYLIGLPLLLGNRDPDESERASGANAVIVFERSEDMK